MKSAGIIAAVLVAGIVAFLLIHFQGGKSGVSVGVRKAEASCTDKAPRCLPKMTMIDTAGTAWTPEALAGKVVVVNVWATWCRPCAAEIPDLIKVQKRYADKNVVLLGLLNDNVADDKLQSFAERFHINYPIVRMDDELYDVFDHPDMLPTTFVYDTSGHLRFDEPGAMSQSQLSGVLDELLSE